jgi:dolichol-phosphate mannosyltransferase
MRSSIQNNISIVIPVYNEQDSIGHLIQELQSPETSLFEIVVVDDASRDDTFRQLKNLQNQYPNLSLVRHKKNMGQSAAVVTGVRAAKFDWIVTLDGDGQNDPADIPKLIEAANHILQSGVMKVVCLGYRVNRQDTPLRKLSSVIANGVRKLFLKDDCPDTGCGIKLFPKNLFLQLPHFRNCHRFLPALFKLSGATLVNVAVTHRKREHGTSKYGVMNRLWVGIVDLLGVAWLMRRSIQVDTHDEL